MGKRPALNVQELEEVKALRASGLTFHAIGKRLNRDLKTIKRVCLDPKMAMQIEETKIVLADHFGDIAVEMLVSISAKDIEKINALQRVTAAAIAVDKQRLLVGLSTQNVSISTIVEEIERSEAAERREKKAQEGTVPAIS